MTAQLIRWFVPRADQTRDPHVRERYGLLAGGVGIVCNAFLCLMKLLIGMATHSISITADAINNLSDGLSSVISLIGFKLSGREPDQRHPFGYGRTEYIAGFVVAFLILQVGWSFLKSSVTRILHPEAVAFHPALLALLGLSMLIKLWMGAFNRHVGRAIQSPALLAAMQDSINDVITTAVVIIGMVVSRFTTLPVDGYIGVLVALFILWAGIGIARDTLGPLIGEAADPEVAEEIRSIVRGMPGILGVHDLIMHNYGAGRSLASLHAEVRHDVDLLRIHEVIDEAERLVWDKTGIFLVIHMDPVLIDDERVQELREIVIRQLKRIDERLTMHDFRVVDGKSRINLIFDVVTPFDYKGEARHALGDRIEEALRQEDSRYHAIITLDHPM